MRFRQRRGAARSCLRWRGSRDSNFSHADGSVRERLSGGYTRAGKVAWRPDANCFGPVAKEVSARE